jgi:hypothetical protein
MREPKVIPDFIRMDTSKLVKFPKAAILVFSVRAQRASWDMARIDRITKDASADVGCLNIYCRP